MRPSATTTQPAMSKGITPWGGCVSCSRRRTHGPTQTIALHPQKKEDPSRRSRLQAHPLNVRKHMPNSQSTKKPRLTFSDPFEGLSSLLEDIGEDDTGQRKSTCRICCHEQRGLIELVLINGEPSASDSRLIENQSGLKMNPNAIKNRMTNHTCSQRARSVGMPLHGPRRSLQVSTEAG